MQHALNLSVGLNARGVRFAKIGLLNILKECNRGQSYKIILQPFQKWNKSNLELWEWSEFLLGRYQYSVSKIKSVHWYIHSNHMWNPMNSNQSAWQLSWNLNHNSGMIHHLWVTVHDWETITIFYLNWLSPTSNAISLTNSCSNDLLYWFTASEGSNSMHVPIFVTLRRQRDLQSKCSKRQWAT